MGFPHKTDNPAKLCLTLHVVFMLDGSTLNVDGRAVFRPSSSMSDPAIQRSIIAIICSRGIQSWWGMTSSMSTMKQNMYEQQQLREHYPCVKVVYACSQAALVKVRGRHGVLQLYHVHVSCFLSQNTCRAMPASSPRGYTWPPGRASRCRCQVRTPVRYAIGPWIATVSQG